MPRPGIKRATKKVQRKKTTSLSHPTPDELFKRWKSMTPPRERIPKGDLYAGLRGTDKAYGFNIQPASPDPGMRDLLLKRRVEELDKIFQRTNSKNKTSPRNRGRSK